MKWTRIRTWTGELNDLIRSMMGDLNPDVPLEQRIATYGKVISGLLQRHGDRIYALETQVNKLMETINELQDRIDDLEDFTAAQRN